MQNVIAMGLVDIFGSNNPSAKVLDFFRVNLFWDYSLRDVMNDTGVSYRTLQKIVPRFVFLGILKYSRTEGKAKMYIFNKKNAIAKQIQTIAISHDAEKAEGLCRNDTCVELDNNINIVHISSCSERTPVSYINLPV